MDASRCDVAVIGAGCSGTALAIALMQRMPAGSRIVLVGAPGEVGVGLAYRPANPDLLVNVRAARMSLLADDEGHFVRWLAEKCVDDAPLAEADLAQLYVGRAVYGRYVRETLFNAMQETRERVAIEIVEDRAISLRPAEEEFRIALAGGRRLMATSVALCLGNASGHVALAGGAVDPAADGRMIADPWNDPRLRMIPPDARVLFVGTGLTMVDQALRLRRAGHFGPLTAVSRHGLLPAAQPDLPVAPLDVAFLLRNRRLSGLFRAVVRAARQAEAVGRDWRSVIEGLRPATQELWQGFGAAERRRFRRHVEAYWSIHRHRMAPAAVHRIAALRESGQLRIRASRVVSVDAEADALCVALRSRKHRTVETLRFDWVVNCTGPGRYAGLARQPLVARLLEQGLARPDDLRLGLDVSPESMVIGRRGQLSTGLFAVGPLAAGRFFEITAVREIVAQTAEIADRLAARKLAELFPRGRPRSAERRNAAAF